MSIGGDCIYAGGAKARARGFPGNGEAAAEEERKNRLEMRGERRDLISRLKPNGGDRFEEFAICFLRERYCVDILTQVSSVFSALKAFSKELYKAI